MILRRHYFVRGSGTASLITGIIRDHCSCECSVNVIYTVVERKKSLNDSERDICELGIGLGLGLGLGPECTALLI